MLPDQYIREAPIEAQLDEELYLIVTIRLNGINRLEVFLNALTPTLGSILYTCFVGMCGLSSMHIL